jgi:hypothetical protein
MDAQMIQTKIKSIYDQICSVVIECRTAVEKYTAEKTDAHFAEIQRITAISSTLWDDYQGALEQLYDAENAA